jgi:predicted nucleic acid-binding protein
MAGSRAGTSGPSAGPARTVLHVLVDTNVVLDLVLAREPWATQAKPLWSARDAGQLIACLPASVLTDVFYIYRKQIGVDRAKAVIEECSRRFVILAVDHALMQTALSLPGSDCEDNVRIACAQLAAIDLIVTRNVADFVHSPVPVLDPPALIVRLGTP